MTTKLKKGECLIEVFNGPNGASIYLGDDSSGLRLAGPKPWGSLHPIFRFVVKIEELRRELDSLEVDHDNQD